MNTVAGRRYLGNYASVTEQSGLRAGDAGFNVSVQGNTDLTGGAITSTQAALDHEQNRFSTGGTLTTRDLQNQAHYKATAVGVNLGTGVSLDGKLAPQGTSAGLGKDSGNAQSTTQAAISGIAGNKQARTGDAETGIGKIFDADKVQKEINAQVQITQTFGREASRAVDDYTEKQMSTLRKRYAAETDPEKQKALQAEVDRLRLETHVLNVLIGGVTGLGGTAFTKESLSAAAEEMRQITIENSNLKRFSVVTDGDFVLSNASGKSVGGKWDLDPTKTGGTRVDLDGVCGADNKRCVTKDDGNGNRILDLKDGAVQWDSDGADDKSLPDWLKTPEGQKMAGLTGGIQGAEGTLFGIPYAAGSWQDKLIEAFGGMHDFIGGQAVGLYDEQGNIQRGMTDAERTTYNTWSAVAIAPAIPFAASELLPPEVWKAISILLGAAK